MTKEELHLFLEEKHERYNLPDFIPSDPISIPHQFSRKEDIEIAGLLTATIAWGSVLSSSKMQMKSSGEWIFPLMILS